jgi:N-acetylmuramoyl-L-alanine amidase
VIEHPSPNRRPRPPGAAVATLVLHYTGMRSGTDAIARLCDPAAAVSSHYVVDEDGTVFRLVPEAERAAHAGVSFWRGVDGLNDTSVGIEIVNPGHEWGYRPFPPAQIDAVTALCRDIVARHRIEPLQVVGHSDIAPDRKQDPGELFPWRALALAGIGFWPDLPGTLDVPPEVGLRRIGYGVGDLATVVAAFQRHWRPGRVDGIVDAETAGVIAAVSRGALPHTKLGPGAPRPA